jgi:hypothetical protein
VRCQQLLDVIFERQFRMDLAPLLFGTHEGEEHEQLLHLRCAEGVIERVKTIGFGRGLQEYMRGAGKDRPLKFRVGRRKCREGLGQGGARLDMRE